MIVNSSFKSKVPAPESDNPWVGTVRVSEIFNFFADATERIILSVRLRLVSVESAITSNPFDTLLAAEAETYATLTLSKTKWLLELFKLTDELSVFEKIPPPSIFNFDAPRLKVAPW